MIHKHPKISTQTSYNIYVLAGEYFENNAVVVTQYTLYNIVYLHGPLNPLFL